MKSSDCWYKEVCDDYFEQDLANGYTNDCRNYCAKYITMTYLMENSGIPVNKRKPIVLQPEKCDLEAFRRLAEIKDSIDTFVAEGKNLYITSSRVGNSKTSWSLKLMMKYFEKTWQDNEFRPTARIVHVPTFLLKCKDFKTVDPEFEKIKRQLLDMELVVWDDVAGTNMSDYDYSQLLVILDSREFNGLSNIFTGNLTSREDIEEALGAKLASRMWNSNTEVIEFFGSERR